MISRHLTIMLLPAAFTVSAADKPAEPYINPHWAASSYPVTHARSDFTSIAGPTGPSHRLKGDELIWKKVGPINPFAPMYSGPYPNGKRVIWIGGYDRVAKLDADTLEVLTTYGIGGNTFFGDDEIERKIATMDAASDSDLVGVGKRIFAEPFRSSVVSFYRLLSEDNELYLPHQYADGSISLQVYGESDAKDPASKIQLRREWKIPPEVSKAATLMGMTMTSDGAIVFGTMDGVLIAVSKDLSRHAVLRLPSNQVEAPDQDVFSAFLRNNVTADDHNGIYVVTRDHMHRVAWTGDKLSLDEADGAWSADYPDEFGIGSGTSPALMGWGDKEDHLVVIADGTKGNNMLAFWRDGIPADWKAIPGYDRRIAGVTKVHFGVSPDEQAQVENALVVKGYSAFINNTFPEQRLPDQGSNTKQWMAESFYMHVPGHEAKGGTVIRWDSGSRTLKTVWQNQINYVSTVCTVSGPTNLLYCWGARNREWTLEGVDWDTGKSAFVYTMGKSHRFNPLGAAMVVAPNGAVDCGCLGGLGLVRVQAKKKSWH